MLIDWTHWISSLHPEQLLFVLCGVLFIDGPRYALLHLLMFLYDFSRDGWRWLNGYHPDSQRAYCPSVCVILAGYNEADTIEASLGSILGTYPRLEIIIVDDGSEDEMLAVSQRLARAHREVMVLSKPIRGGKSSCINFAVGYSRAEVVVIVDTDSHLAPGAIWGIVQPLVDPQVGAVSATILARNAFTNLLTCFQAYEYLHSIFVGRIASARLGILSVCSGAFAAFRRSAVEEAMGWDVGPGEDGDLTIRLRKAGYKIAFTPYAQCFTNVPTTWWSFFKQRRRWNRGAVRYKCRKHIDMAYFWSPNFRFTNLLVLLNIWFFSIICLYGFWINLILVLINFDHNTWNLFLVVYVGYLAVHVIQVGVILFYSNARLRDAAICIVIPLVPAYQFFRKIARLVSVTEELFFRKSFEDNYVPPRVRAATWHW